MSAGNRRGGVRALEASFLWARVLVKKWTRSAVAQRARGPCPAGLELALGQREQVESRSSGSRFAESPGVSKPRRQRTGPGRHPTRGAQERSVAAQPVATAARAGHTSRPRPETDTGSPTIAGRLARSPIPADSCANSEMAARWARRSVLVRLFAIGTVGCAALRTVAGPQTGAHAAAVQPERNIGTESGANQGARVIVAVSAGRG
jgi:hypothetical protein